MLRPWEIENEPVWKKYLRDTNDYVIGQTGLSRKKLEEVLDVLHEHRIIN